MSSQIGLGLLAVSAGLVVTALLGAMIRYEAKSGKSLYWFGPGFRLTRESNPAMFRVRLVTATLVAAVCAIVTFWFAIRFLEMIWNA
jgi:hypothetical protein